MIVAIKSWLLTINLSMCKHCRTFWSFAFILNLTWPSLAPRPWNLSNREWRNSINMDAQSTISSSSLTLTCLKWTESRWQNGSGIYISRVKHKSPTWCYSNPFIRMTLIACFLLTLRLSIKHPNVWYGPSQPWMRLRSRTISARISWMASAPSPCQNMPSRRSSIRTS